MLPSDPKQDVASLDTSYPLVLFPVRIETRFEQNPSKKQELKIRIYPDAIAIHTHDPRLTGAERTAGEIYWRVAWKDKSKERQAEKDAWHALLQQFPAPRAAWVVHATEPSNLNSSRRDKHPRFPKTESRPWSWSRPAESHVLPDRWVAIAYRKGQEIYRATSLPVQERLALSISPNQIKEKVELPGGLKVDDQIAWMFDFERAEKVGMAVRMQLQAQDILLGFDRLIVLGVKASLNPAKSQVALEELLNGHHYTQGLAFVQQGTATNNTGSAASAYRSFETNARQSFHVERGNEKLETLHAGTLAAEALGIDHQIFAHVYGAQGIEQKAAKMMNRALWEVTLGYYMKQMMNPIFQPGQVEDAKQHFVNFVSGRGPLPALRVGDIPYGLLPVTSLTRWQPHPGDSNYAYQKLGSGLERLRNQVWQKKIKELPQIGRTPHDPDLDLIELLGMDASARQVRVRYALGEGFAASLSKLLGIDWVSWQLQQNMVANWVLKLVGQPNWKPRLLRMSFYDQAYRFGHVLVDQAPLSETNGLKDNYIQKIGDANWQQLRAFSESNPQPLLYLMLKHAALLEYLRAALISKYGEESITGDGYDREFYNIVSRQGSIWDLLGDDTLNPLSIPAFKDALAELKNLPTAELERIFGETLDLSSHRLDAWITSLATKRLHEQRSVHEDRLLSGSFRLGRKFNARSVNQLQASHAPRWSGYPCTE